MTCGNTFFFCFCFAFLRNTIFTAGPTLLPPSSELSPCDGLWVLNSARQAELRVASDSAIAQRHSAVLGTNHNICTTSWSILLPPLSSQAAVAKKTESAIS